MRSTEELLEYLRERLVSSIEIKAARYEDEEWREGIKGAILEGQLSLLRELIDWVEGKEAS